MKIIDWLCAIVVFALEIVHSALTPVIYRPLSLSALWFFAAGLAMVFAGMLNVLRLKGPGSPLLHFFSSVANATLLLVAVLFCAQGQPRAQPSGGCASHRVGGRMSLLAYEAEVIQISDTQSKKVLLVDWIVRIGDFSPLT